MPRRFMLTAADWKNLLALPESNDELIRHYTFSETDRALIRLRQGDANQAGFNVQLCLLQDPGHAMAGCLRVGRLRLTRGNTPGASI